MVKLEWIVPLLSTMNLKQLKLLAIFAQVVEHGTFAEAARKLHSSRSRISEQVSLLEADLGVRLLQRTTRKLQLTDEGKQIVQQAVKLADILQEVEALATPCQPNGRVAISMNHNIAHKFILPLLPSFQQKFPKIKLDLLLSDEKQDLIAEQIDLAIRIGFPTDSSLVARAMHEETFSLFASPQFIQTYGKPTSLDDLQQCQWIFLEQITAGNILRLKKAGQTIEIKPDNYYLCNSPYMTQKMVLNGLGISALLPCTVKNEIAQGNLISVMPEIYSDALVFSLLYPSRKQIPARTRAVIDFLLTAKIFS